MVSSGRGIFDYCAPRPMSVSMNEINGAKLLQKKEALFSCSSSKILDVVVLAAIS